MHISSQTRTISVVSEETKKQLDQMILQNKELEGLLSKTRSDNDAKVCFRLSTKLFLLSVERQKRCNGDVKFFLPRARGKESCSDPLSDRF